MLTCSCLLQVGPRSRPRRSRRFAAPAHSPPRPLRPTARALAARLRALWMAARCPSAVRKKPLTQNPRSHTLDHARPSRCDGLQRRWRQADAPVRSGPHPRQRGTVQYQLYGPGAVAGGVATSVPVGPLSFALYNPVRYELTIRYDLRQADEIIIRTAFFASASTAGACPLRAGGPSQLCTACSGTQNQCPARPARPARLARPARPARPAQPGPPIPPGLPARPACPPPMRLTLPCA
jgi:hypothetical protein